MEHADVEMISEWPITGSSSQDEKNSELDVSAPGIENQQSLLHKCSVTNEHSSCDIKSGKTYHELTYTSNVSCTDADYSKKNYTVNSKLPQNYESEKHETLTSREDTKSNETFKISGDTNNLKREACAVKISHIPCKQRCLEPASKNFEKTLGHHEILQKSPAPCKFQSLELLAHPRLARWWRREGQHLCQRKETLPCTTNPNTLLYHVARLPDGQSFLKGERQAIKTRLEQRDITGMSLAALGSIEDWLGNPQEAVHYLKWALKLEPHNMEWQWLLHKAQCQLKVQQRQAELLLKIPPEPLFPQMLQVEKVSCKDMGFAEFFYRYAMQRRPVIITDMVDSMTTIPWDLQHIRDIAGDCVAKVKQPVTGSVEWAGLEDSQSVKVSQFLDNLHVCHDYLFDWSLPLHCPRLAEELIIPQYFAGDFLQRTSQGSQYQDSWPSLFVAPPGVQGSLHVDAFASNFWMALFQGRKRWVFFPEEDTPCLYPVYAHSLDPTFEAKVTDPDLKTHPLLSLTHPTECILNAGEIIFVPGGCPHIVQNIDTTLAISANYVDVSNFSRVLDELQVNALLDPRAADLLKQFRQQDFLCGMKSNIGDLPWIEFKTWQATNREEYDIWEGRTDFKGKSVKYDNLEGRTDLAEVRVQSMTFGKEELT